MHRNSGEASRPRLSSRAANLAVSLLVALGVSGVALFAGPAAADTSRDCAVLGGKTGEAAELQLRLAGVPAILSIPKTVTKPPIILWHGFAAPGDKEALSKALPLDQVPAVKVYLDLPLFGERLPAGGVKELARRQSEDFGTLLFKPAVEGAADELAAVVDALKHDGCMLPKDKIGLFGFSAGGTAVLVALMQKKVPVGVAVTLNASTGFGESVEALERLAKTQYHWTDADRAVAHETDAIAHAADIARGAPALLIIQGRADTTLDPSRAGVLHDALLPYYQKTGSDRLELLMVPQMDHDWTKAATADQARHAVAGWFNHFL